MEEGDANVNADPIVPLSGQTNEDKLVKQPSIESVGGDSSASNKIDVLLKATGDAPILKRKKYLVEDNHTIGWIIQFIRKCLKLEASDSLFLYVNQTFAPSPDQTVRNLYECFGADGKLVLHYAKTQAWG